MPVIYWPPDPDADAVEICRTDRRHNAAQAVVALVPAAKFVFHHANGKLHLIVQDDELRRRDAEFLHGFIYSATREIHERVRFEQYEREFPLTNLGDFGLEAFQHRVVGVRPERIECHGAGVVAREAVFFTGVHEAGDKKSVPYGSHRLCHAGSSEVCCNGTILFGCSRNVYTVKVHTGRLGRTGFLLMI